SQISTINDMDIKKHLRNHRYVGAQSSKIGCIISKIDCKSNCRHTSIVLLADVQGSFSPRVSIRKATLDVCQKYYARMPTITFAINLTNYTTDFAALCSNVSMVT